MAIGDGDGGGEPARERQVPDQVEASDVVVPPHALRISAAAHPEGPMLGFLLPEPGVGASADVDTDASSIGADIGVNMGSDLGFFLDTLSPRPGAGAGWIDWGTGQVFSAAATGISTSMAAAGEYTGDGTIDPSVLGGNIGSPGKFRLDMNHAVAAGSPSGYAMNNEDEDVDMDEEEEEEDVIGMLFEDPIDGDGDDLGSKGKSKATVNPQRIGARIRRKSWRKALGDEQTEQSVKKSGGRDEYKNKYQEGPSAPASMSLRLRSPTRPARGSIHSSMPAEMTFCHHCRRKTRRPKMHCTRIKESTGQRCRKAFCDLCIEKRYPELTFDVLVPAFACPSCRNFCNCSHCSRARGEAYVPERNGGWRKWGTSPKTRAIADNSNDKGPAKARKRARTSSATVEKVLKGPSLMKTYEARSTALFTVSGEPLGEVFLNGGNVAHVVLTQQQPIMKAPSASSASAPQLTLKTPAPPATSVPVPRRKRRIHVYIGKQLKAWGRVVLIPEPNEEKQKQKKKARAGRGKGKRTRMRVRLFVGSEEPLLLGCMGKRQKRSASLALALTSASGVEDDEDVDVEGVDEGCEGVWPGEYAILPGSVDGPPSQPPPSTTDLSSNTQTALRITPDEVERAIGAAFAAGTQQPQGIDKF
ncbi:hypothetical protein B0F90DRAFT_281454 [Multifurca ochricompacta]|uniref:Zinc-finger domain-containing protein n=1 Tax=Multifurca ochricompacta TaxID=376703 RepID=A0AAD4QJJ3_9AGAM|nr:hypothetical protein B0F90DRAFT_281454 [Multifurca ochricompacta]